MLAKSEIPEGLSLSAVFSKMLRDIPWGSLRSYVVSNPQLSKVCTRGFRLEPQFRNRIEQAILREAESSEFSELQCNGLFIVWYPIHKELHAALEEYFHSQEYKDYLQANELKEDEYLLNEEKFDGFYNVKDFEFWRILLCFSPMQFSKRQMQIVLEDKKNDADMMQRITEAESNIKDYTRKIEALTAEAERLRARQQEDQREIQELRRLGRQADADKKELQTRVDTAVAEMKRANQRAAQSDSAVAVREAQIREELGRIISRQEGDIARLNKELAAWQNRHEEQCGLNRGFIERADQADKRLAEALAARADSDTRLQNIQKAVDAILSRIDWTRLGSDLKLSPTMKKNFASLLRKLDYDENRGLTIEGTLPAFWERQMTSERNLINAIASSAENEITSGTIQEYWNELSEEFVDVATSLEARGFMLAILQGIFYQDYSTEDFEEKAMTPKPPKSAKTEKAEKTAKTEKAKKVEKTGKAPRAKKAAEKTTAKRTSTSKTAAEKITKAKTNAAKK